MPTIDLTSHKYVTTDGKGFEVDFGQLPLATVLNMLERTCGHVFGNEAISKASTAKKANGGDLDDAERESIINEARVKYRDAMYAGTWGEKGARAPRMPAANRLEQIFNMLCAEDTRKAIAKAGLKAGETKNTWLGQDGREYTLEQCMRAYIDDPKQGDARKASLTERAERKLADEKADAEQRKRDREREAAAGGGLALAL